MSAPIVSQTAHLEAVAARRRAALVRDCVSRSHRLPRGGLAGRRPIAGPSGGAGQEPITPIPAAPALDPLRRLLGERLFNDRRLSRADTHSCASCHDVETNGASARDRDTSEGLPIALNAPTVFNVSLNFRLNWEGDVPFARGGGRT